MKGRIRKLLIKILEPLVQFLLKIGITPNKVTSIGFLISILAALSIALKNHFLGGSLVLVNGFFDILDGTLARQIKSNRRFGALLDSTIDRFSEAIIFLGILISVKGSLSYTILIFGAFIGSFMVSYTRARAEGLEFKCEIGLLTRVERVVILGLFLLLNKVFIALWIIAILSEVTVLHRLFYVYKKDSL